jgi:hypothetical protein
MKTKPVAAGSSPAVPSARQSTARGPLPQVERVLRGAFPEVWARYEFLAAARGILVSRASASESTDTAGGAIARRLH